MQEVLVSVCWSRGALLQRNPPQGAVPSEARNSGSCRGFVGAPELCFSLFVEHVGH